MSEKEKDNLEYNDGLGDLLREKEKREFSWTKTLVVLISTIGIIIVLLNLLIDYSKSLLLEKETTTTLSIESTTPHQSEEKLLEKIEIIENQTEKTITKKSVAKTQPPAVKPKASNNTLNFKVIVGTFTQIENAKNFVKMLQKNKVDTYIWTQNKNNTTLYRVQAGAFKDYQSANQLVKSLQTKKIDSYVLQQ